MQNPSQPSAQVLSWPALLLMCAASCWLHALTAHAQPSKNEQRNLFLQAEKLWERGDAASYERVRGQLADYPLLPYLELAETRAAQYANVSDAEYEANMEAIYKVLKGALAPGGTLAALGGTQDDPKYRALAERVGEQACQLTNRQPVAVRHREPSVSRAAAGDVQQRSIHGQPAEGVRSIQHQKPHGRTVAAAARTHHELFSTPWHSRFSCFWFSKILAAFARSYSP